MGTSWVVVIDIAFVSASLFLAAVLGFAVHRGGICNVKAVEKVITTRRAYLL
jgi:hypothetical protein